MSVGYVTERADGEVVPDLHMPPLSVLEVNVPFETKTSSHPCPN